MCWSKLILFYESQLCISLLFTQQPEVGYDGNIYTMEMRKYYKWGLSFTSPFHPISLFSIIRFFRTNLLVPNYADKRGTSRSFVRKCYKVKYVLEILHKEMR